MKRGTRRVELNDERARITDVCRLDGIDERKVAGVRFTGNVRRAVRLHTDRIGSIKAACADVGGIQELIPGRAELRYESLPIG